MRNLFINIFSNEQVGPEITLFGVWHILYFILIIGLTVLFAVLINKKEQDSKRKILDYLAIVVLVVYLGDFFIQPFYNGDQLIIDKLPFHICTIMAPLIIITRFNKRASLIKPAVACLSLVVSLMYLTYPGSAIGDISCFSYKVIQTFLYHGLVYAYGFLSLSTGEVKLTYKKIYVELIILVAIAFWAALGNTLYSTPSHHYDWFFITGSTFPFIPKIIMPVVVVVSIFIIVSIIYLIYFGYLKYYQKKRSK